MKEAYRQLAAFQQGLPWVPPGKYRLIARLTYREVAAALKRGVTEKLNTRLRRIAGTTLREPQGLPIGFIARYNDEVYVVFRGTMTVREIARNLDITMSRYPYAECGKVHEGFLRIYKSFRVSLLDSLKGVGTDKRLYIVGHSLGAALATLAVPDISSATSFAAPVAYTFASPRVGDKNFAAGYNRLCQGHSFRVANSSDIVVSLPFPVPFLNFIGGYFTHVDEPVEFTDQAEDAEGITTLGRT